jgi:hypothetical protein
MTHLVIVVNLTMTWLALDADKPMFAKKEMNNEQLYKTKKLH